MLLHVRKLALSLVLCLVGGSASTGTHAQVLSFSANAQNFTNAPTNFIFLLSSPTTTMSAGGTFLLTLDGTITDTDGNGVSVTPSGANTFLFQGGGGGTYYLNTGAGFVNTTNTTPGRTFTYPTSTSSVVTPVTLNSLNLSLSILLSGGGDSASFSGSIRYIPFANVPEPGSLLFLGSTGVSGGLVWMSRRKAARQA